MAEIRLLEEWIGRVSRPGVDGQKMADGMEPLERSAILDHRKTGARRRRRQ